MKKNDLIRVTIETIKPNTNPPIIIASTMEIGNDERLCEPLSFVIAKEYYNNHHTFIYHYLKTCQEIHFDGPIPKHEKEMAAKCIEILQESVDS